MNRLGLTISDETIQQFDSYRNYEHQISEAIREISSGLMQEIGTMVSAGEGEGAVMLFKQLLAIFGTDETMATDITLSETPSHSVITPQHIGMTASNGFTSALDDLPLQNRQELLLLLRETGFTQELAVFIADASQSSESSQSNQSTALTEGQENISLPHDTVVGQGEVATTEGLTTSQENTVNPPMPSFIDILARELLPNDSAIDVSKLTTLLGHRDFRTLLANNLNNQWLMEPEELSDSRQVNEHFRQILSQTARLGEALTTAGRSDSATHQAVTNLNSNIQFLNQLNQTFTYLQLPLKMNDENTHGELFIYTNKKHLARNDGNVSALLHLDMEHLGPLDVYVAMQNKHVSTKFYLANEQVIDLIALHIDVLTERLEKRGYGINNEFIARAVDKQPIEEILDARKNVSVIGSYSFDARA
jgi:hypothetical protein